MPPPTTAKMKSTSAIKPRQTMRGHTKWVTDIVQLLDGQRIITCSEDGSLRLWNLESGIQVGNNWRDDGKEATWSIALSPNGKTVASGSSNGTMRLWDVETKNVVARWTRHSDALRSLCWSVDGERVVSGSDDGTIRVWDVESGEAILGPIKTGHRYVYAVIYSPDTTKIATGGYSESALKIWDAKTGNLLSTIKHDSMVWSLAWTSDQKKLITASNTSIRVFDIATWQQIAILEGHTDTVFSLSLFQNDRLLASTSWDKTARLWSLDTNLPVGPPLQHQARVDSAAISANGMLLFTACDDKNAYVWDIHTTLKDAGLEELLSVPDVSQDGLKQQAITRKSLMDTDATRPLAKHGYTCRLPPRFLDDVQDGVHSPAAPPHRRNLVDFLPFTPPPIVSPTSTRSQHTPEPIAQSSTTTSSAITSRLYVLSKWWPVHTRHVLPPVIDVPLTQGDQRIATAGAPKGNGRFRRDEDFDLPPPSQIHDMDSQRPPIAQKNTGEHGSGRFCFCL